LHTKFPNIEDIVTSNLELRRFIVLHRSSMSRKGS